MKAVYIRDFPKGEKNRVGTCFQYCLWLGIWKENQWGRPSRRGRKGGCLSIPKASVFWSQKSRDTEAIGMPNTTKGQTGRGHIVEDFACQIQGAWGSCVWLISLSGYLCPQTIMGCLEGEEGHSAFQRILDKVRDESLDVQTVVSLLRLYEDSNPAVKAALSCRKPDVNMVQPKGRAKPCPPKWLVLYSGKMLSGLLWWYISSVA